VRRVQEQMQDRAAQQVEAAAAHERERAMVDAVMAAIDEEDRLQGELKRRKAAETLQYIQDFIADREARAAAQRRSDSEEERKIQARPRLDSLAASRPVRWPVASASR
jgi:Trichohyalin-plectin-homology domain